MRIDRLAALVRRSRWAPVSVLAGVVATGVLAVSMNGTLAAYTASITHSGDSANLGTLTVQETGPGSNPVVCNSTDGNGINTNAATCSGINHYGGGTFAPNSSVSTTVTLKNTGTVAATTASITFGACTQSNNTAANNQAGSATNLCDVIFMLVQVNVGGTVTLMTQNSISLSAAYRNGAYALPALPAGATASVYFGLALSGTADNTFQGLTATQPFTLRFTS